MVFMEQTLTELAQIQVFRRCVCPPEAGWMRRRIRQIRMEQSVAPVGVFRRCTNPTRSQPRRHGYVPDPFVLGLIIYGQNDKIIGLILITRLPQICPRSEYEDSNILICTHRLDPGANRGEYGWRGRRS